MIDLRAVRRRAEALARSIKDYRRGRVRVRDYRLNYGEGRSATLGVHDSRVGSVYSPFQVSDGVRGSFFVAWQDGKVSRGLIDGNQGPDLDDLLEASFDARYSDPDARLFAGPVRVLPTPIHHPGIARIVDGRFAPLYDIVELLCRRGDELGVKKVSGSAQASVGVSVILSSRGLAYAGVSGECSYAFGYDGELWDGRARRRPFTLREVDRTIDRAALLLPHLGREVSGARSGPARVLLLPAFASELVEAFVVANLYGSEVASGQAAFKPADFRARRQVFRNDLRLRVDPTVPLSSGSYRITSEGMAARPVVYVERGRLLRPIVGLKFARRLRTRPTTPPTSMESVWLEAGSSWSERRALAEIGDGFAVLSALGLHTQDAASGDYSLTAPRALVVRGGRVVGATKAVLAGNFFQSLRDPDTRLVKVPGTRFPGLLLRAQMTVS